MATPPIFKFVEVQFTKLSNQVDTFIQTTYNKSSSVLSPADPFGHILKAVEAIYQQSNVYLKNIVAQFDIKKSNKPQFLWFASRIAGHDPTRGISATGTLRLQIKPDQTVEDDIPGGQITIFNKTRLTNKSNGRIYFVDMGGVDSSKYTIVAGQSFYLPLVQGTMETQTVTGTGAKNQSFSINVPSNKFIENFRVTVSVNGVVWAKKDFVDLLASENACCVRTGMTGGLDVYFGNGNMGAIPPLAATIVVEYLLTDGSLGNIPSIKDNDWTFTDDAYDAYGNTIDATNIFDIYINDEISLGGDGESIEFTRAILPMTSKNYVLATPEQFMYTLQRLGIFSQVYAYTTPRGITNENGVITDDSVVYLFLVPDINIYLQGTGFSYFDIDITAFSLTDAQELRIMEYLKIMGTICIGTSIVIKQPVILNYVIHIYLYIYDDAIEDNIRSQILQVLSSYFLTTNRRDRIPRSDVIGAVEAIDGIDSVDVQFISAANEAYHLAYTNYVESLILAQPTIDPTTIIMPGYDPTTVLGLDPQFGDIVINQDELPIIRGGFTDRNQNTYNEIPTTKGLSSVNIHYTGVIKRRLTI
jgi:hypothetical protein